MNKRLLLLLVQDFIADLDASSIKEIQIHNLLTSSWSSIPWSNPEEVVYSAVVKLGRDAVAVIGGHKDRGLGDWSVKVWVIRLNAGTITEQQR